MVSKRAFEKIEFRGRTFDRITKAGVLHLEDLLGAVVSLYQGPYSGADTSAGTHTGSGAIDFAPVPGKTVDEVLKAGRRAGWALYHRPRLVRAGKQVWPEHFHGIQIGNPGVSPSAAKQVQDFYGGLDALASHAPDKDPWRPNPIVGFKFPLGFVNLANVQREAKAPAKKKKAIKGVREIQRALNLKTGTHLLVDGIYGPQTKAAFSRYEKQVGGDGDGIPGRFALRLLGAARFRVGEPKWEPSTTGTKSGAR